MWARVSCSSHQHSRGGARYPAMCGGKRRRSRGVGWSVWEGRAVQGGRGAITVRCDWTGVAEEGGLELVLGVCNLRLRRPLDGSPKTEVRVPFRFPVTSFFGERLDGSPKREFWDLFWGSVTSVFGEWLVVSPMVEVGGLFSGCVSSVFGERLVVLPKTEVRDLFSGSVTSVFGDP